MMRTLFQISAELLATAFFLPLLILRFLWMVVQVVWEETGRVLIND